MANKRDRILTVLRMARRGGGGWITTGEISRRLSIGRTYVSRLLNELVDEGEAVKTNSRPVLYQYNDRQDPTDRIAEELVGFNGSLERAVRLAKAVSLYPGAKMSAVYIRFLHTTDSCTVSE